MFDMKECIRNNFCYECDNKDCLFCGDIRADCPKYKCDLPESIANDCEHCTWIRRLIEKMKEGD